MSFQVSTTLTDALHFQEEKILRYPPIMTVSTVALDLDSETHALYEVTFFGDTIQTLVTNTPAIVDSWIQNVENSHRHAGDHRLIVGLDVEWRPNFNTRSENPVATLQLCVGRDCLIFQLLHAPTVPTSLIAFLRNPGYTFVGVGIDEDLEKLVVDYGLGVSRSVDLRGLAAHELNNMELRNAGLKRLGLEVLGKEVHKPRRVTMSRWDNFYLSIEQVQYACVDAFLSSEIGTALNAARP